MKKSILHFLLGYYALRATKEIESAIARIVRNVININVDHIQKDSILKDN